MSGSSANVYEDSMRLPIFIDVFIKFLRTRLFTGLKPWPFLTCCAQFPNTFKARRAKAVGKGIMRSWAFVFLILGITGSAFARLGDTEKQLTVRYGKPVSVSAGGKYNPYFEKLIDFQKEENPSSKRTSIDY
jgi:hypothetical protein